MAEFALDLFGFGAKTASTSLIKGNTGARASDFCLRQDLVSARKLRFDLSILSF
jgi:hypothetical protein